MIETIISLPVLISGAIMDFKYRKVFIMPFIMASACGIIVNAAVYKRDFKHYALGVGLIGATETYMPYIQKDYGIR